MRSMQRLWGPGGSIRTPTLALDMGEAHTFTRTHPKTTVQCSGGGRHEPLRRSGAWTLEQRGACESAQQGAGSTKRTELRQSKEHQA